MVMSGLLGAYEMGRTLGEGSFGKVKLARHRATGVHFAVKVLDRARILTLRIHDQVRTTACVLHHRPPGRFSID
jgi:5'-AMP-activated protein kinase, catalytic alpha subunit